MSTILLQLIFEDEINRSPSIWSEGKHLILDYSHFLVPFLWKLFGCVWLCVEFFFCCCLFILLSFLDVEKATCFVSRTNLGFMVCIYMFLLKCGGSLHSV